MSSDRNDQENMDTSLSTIDMEGTYTIFVYFYY